MERNINSVIDKLKTIKKDEVDERTFYEQVLTALAELPSDISEEEYDLVRKTLLEIGCVKFKEWKRMQIQRVKLSSANEASVDGNIASAVSYVDQFLRGHSKPTMEILLGEQGTPYGWIKGWLMGNETQREKERVNKQREAEEKSLSPYKRVAKRSLASWGGMTEEEAATAVETLSNDELEGKVYATGSMNAAINQISISCNLTQSEKEQLSDLVYNGLNEGNKGIVELLKQRITSVPKAIMDTLFAVHNSWVESNGKKFLAREKKYQHMPSEFIGWDELKLDLIFVKPIYDALGITVNEDELKKEYIKRIKEYFLSKRLITMSDTVRLITKADEFYPALKGQQANIEFLRDEDNVLDSVIPSIKENGIGDTEVVRYNILYYISKTVQRRDLMRLEPEELQTVRNFIQTEIEDAEEDYGKDSARSAAARIRLLKVDTFLQEKERGELNDKKNEDVEDDE